MESSRKQTARFEDRVIAELEAAPDYGWRGAIFTPKEDEIIRKYYPTKGGAAVAKALNKTRSQVTHRAAEIGVRRIR
jgi:hypothetical protein